MLTKNESSWFTVIKNLCWFSNFYNALNITIVITVFPTVNGKIYWRNNFFWSYVKNLSSALENFVNFIRLNPSFLLARGLYS
jgi:hypothetical protein